MTSEYENWSEVVNPKLTVSNDSNENTVYQEQGISPTDVVRFTIVAVALCIAVYGIIQTFLLLT